MNGPPFKTGPVDPGPWFVCYTVSAPSGKEGETVEKRAGPYDINEALAQKQVLARTADRVYITNEAGS